MMFRVTNDSETEATRGICWTTDILTMLSERSESCDSVEVSANDSR